MNFRKKSKLLLATMLGTALMLSGCSGGSDTKSGTDSKSDTTATTGKKVINIGLRADPPALDPKESTALVDRFVYASLYDKLVEISPEGKIVPMLAESHEVSPDNKTYTFKLKTGVKFHDGTEFNAEAVKFNIERSAKDETSKRKTELKFVESVTVVDANTVKIQLKEPFAPFLSVLSDRSGMMVSPTAAKKYGKDLTNNPVGTGPYVFVEHVKGDHVSLKKNDNYWNGKPKVDEINYKVFTNGTAKVQNLKSGALDMIDDIPVKEITGLKADTNYSVITEPSMGYMGIHMNTSKPPFDNKSLRLAVDRAIDREAVVKVLYNGYALPANSAFSTTSFAHSDIDRAMPPNKEEITKLLTEGGKSGGFSFKMIIGTSPENEQFGAVIQNMLKQYNINVTLEKLEFGQLLETADKGEFEGLFLGWSGRQDPDQNVYDFLIAGGNNNYGKINSPQLDTLLENARKELDESKRKIMYDEIGKITQAEGFYSYVYHQYNLLAMTKKVTGFTYAPDGLVRTATLDKQ